MTDNHPTLESDQDLQPLSILKAWTDYPIAELGDEPGKEAPVRECTPLRYDNDKYCAVLVEGVLTNFKAGYLYTAPGRLGEVPKLNPNLINQWRWVRDCPCGAKVGDACRTFSCQQLKDRYEK